jgi:hypothetical protein
VSDPTLQFRVTRWYAAGNIFLILHHLTMMVVASAYAVQPSRTITVTLEPGWGLVWSIMLGVFGFVGLIARLRQSWMTEAVSVAFVALALVLWGSAMIAVNGTQALQSGLALIAGGFYRAGWASIQAAWVMQPPIVQQVLNMVNDQLGEEGE